MRQNILNLGMADPNGETEEKLYMLMRHLGRENLSDTVRYLIKIAYDMVERGEL